MPARALIIAIENYGKIGDGLVNQLPGTHAAARGVYDWLLKTKGLAAADIWVCTDAAQLPGKKYDADHDDLVDAVSDLINAGQDNTAELYVFYSGHGFFFTNTGGRETADVLIAANFRKLATDGGRCIDLDQLRNELRVCMGPGDHYYFVDACRNEIKSEDVDVASLGLRKQRSRLRQPTVYTLYSTQRGRRASVDSGFPDMLVDGLSGKGRAKVWGRGPGMLVLFDSVKRYLKSRMVDQTVDGAVEGTGEGVILEIKPPPKKTCTVTVVNATEKDAFQLSVQNSRGQVVQQGGFTGIEHAFQQVPDDYYLSVTDGSTPLQPIDAPPADLYEDCTARFMKPPMRLTRPPASPQPVLATVKLQGAPGTSLQLRHLGLGKLIDLVEGVPQKVTPGPVLLKMVDDEGTTLKRLQVEIHAGEAFEADLGRREDRPLLKTLATRLPHDERTVSFSESLGPGLADTDPGLWLALMGASRIVADPSTFSKLRKLPLHSFDEVKEGDAPTYLLAGFDRRTALEAAVCEPLHQVCDWRRLTPVRGLNGIYEGYFSTRPGPKLLAVKVPKLAPLTIATYCLANRATFLTMAADPERGVRIHQFMLPIHSLQAHLPPKVLERVRYNPLRMVKFIATAQRQFERHQPVDPARRPRRRTRSRETRMWQDFLSDKWTDPMMALIAAYELVRRGDLQYMKTVVRNLRRHFAGLPDVEPLAKLSGQASQQPSAAPLLLDGVLACDDRSFLPLPEGRLDFRGPWTCWRAFPG